ncbi:MAG TPA: 2-amino-4-hydroxy-6-hydroxymethyldihydropteridine diphosphokinase [archaeon]|nr:2-amino-4-hydroxy-6-hydroxymethyldihydropteridine diphosphokinase [archaeon]
MNIAVISVGSNLDPRANVTRARDLLEKEQRFLGQSSFVVTRPIGPKDQPDFLNGAFLISTELDLQGLKDALKKIESGMGRVIGADKWGPRTIDLDIVVWNGEVVDNDFYERDFVRNAVIELLPQLAQKKNC